MLTAERIIELLGLEPLPIEGGLYFEGYRSSELLESRFLPNRYPSARSFCTAIYYLLTSDEDSFSAIHRLATDEIYHFYLGDPVELLELHPDGSSRQIVLGQDLLAGQRVQHVVERDLWQGSKLVDGGQLALLGTTMAPGFSPQDYVGGDLVELVARYPSMAHQIEALIRG